MNKTDYFLKAIQAGLFKKKAWVISAFSIIAEDPNIHKEDRYLYRLVQNTVGHFFISEINSGGEPKLEAIEDGVAGQPLFDFMDEIHLKKGDLENVDKDITTTIGNTFFNAHCVIWAFGAKVPFVVGEVNPGKFENMIAANLYDTPKVGDMREPHKFYVDEYLKFVDSVYHLTNYSQLCVIAGTPKTMVAAPGIIEYRKQLIEENKDRLTDPAVIAAIDAKLIAYDNEFLKGDPGERFLISGKSRAVRKKLFGMHGAEIGLNESNKVALIKNSLSEGWDINAFSTMNDSLRAGSHSRGAKTELGGVAFKELLRASSNVTITEDDCGSQVGFPTFHTANSVRNIIGFTVIDEGKQEFVADEISAGKYLGKSIMVRSPMYCHLPATDYCKTCCGKAMSENPTGVSLMVSEYGSAMLYIFMSAAHSKALVLAKMDYKTAIT